MIRSSFRIPRLLAAVLAAASFGGSGVAEADVKFPSVPLYLANGVPPNVMLMIDDSGSMQSIIWDDKYDPGTSYPSWAPAVPTLYPFPPTAAATTAASDWRNGAGQIDAGGLAYGALIGVLPASCGDGFLGLTDSGYTIGIKSNTFKCLKLPKPAPTRLPSGVPSYAGTMYSANYLNYLFENFGTANTVGASPVSRSDLTTGQIPNDYRINVARNVAKSVAADSANSNLKFCLSTLNQSSGGSVLFGCDLLDTSSKRNTYNSKVDSLYAFTYTPLAETMYELTRYFRGMTSYYNSGVTYASGALTTPLKNSYRCQANYAVFITDGYPTQDTVFPGYQGAPTNGETVLSNPSKDVTGGKLPDWDGKHPATSQSDFPGRIPQFSDGFQGSGSGDSTDEGYTLFLDDLASYAYDLDMKSGGNDPAGKSYDDSSINNGKQNLKSFFIGLATRNQMMDDAAGYGAGTPGSGKAFQANNQAQLSAQLQLALNQVTAQTSGAASVAANGGAVSTDSLLYQAVFDSGSWTGDLLAYSFDSSKAGSNCPDNSSTSSVVCSWSASASLDSQYHTADGAAARKVYTYNTDTRKGATFQWTSLSTGQQAVLNVDPSNAPTVDNLGSKRVDYLRGDPTEEFTSPKGLFRPRTHLLGDLVDSNPLYVGPPGYDYGYSGYGDFHKTYANRTPVVYVGGNDGMLHAFQGDYSGKGRELFAYIPGAVYGSTASPQLSKLSSLAYSHTWMVDGPLAAGDAYIAGNWKTVLVGTLGRGGRGIYALDVTSPTTFSGNNVMWEFTSADDADLGYVLGEPTIARINDGSSTGRWAAIVSSGYNNGNAKGQAAVFVLFLDHARGSAWKKNSDYYEILLPNTSSDITSSNQNGAAAPSVIDYNNDGFADTIYVGDLYGDVWKLNQGGTTGKFDVALAGSPLFIAKDASGTRQPITERPNVGYNLLPALANQNKNVVLYFGTGKYLDKTDPSNTGVQTFYGIFDNGFSVAPTISRTNLQVQTVLTTFSASGNTYRTISSNAVNTSTQYGFYLDLPGTASTGATERQIFTPILLDGRIIFTTLIPSNADPCLASTSGWIMELDATNGGQLNRVVFDTNNDNSFTSGDTIVGGVQSANGAPSGLTIINKNDGTEVKFTNGSNGKLSEVKEQSTARLGRISWYELTP